MKKIQLEIVIALAALLVACAPGRYTGGGWIQNWDGSKGPVFNIQNVSAADCIDDDGIAETFKGKVKWDDKVNGVSFVCQASGADGVGKYTIEPEGIEVEGIYYGVVSDYVGASPTATTCEIQVYSPEAGRQDKGVSVLLDNGYFSSGPVGGGNLQSQKVNTKGICSSSK